MAVTVESVAGALAPRYHVRREVGRGGMAVVFLADDTRHPRQVAIKVLERGPGATLGAERFLREIGIAARLSHPHIVALHDSGESGPFLYFVMPYVAGESLGARLRRASPLPTVEALRIAREVADALEHAHGRGIVHRDITPENILLADGHALIADFGIARTAALAAGAEPLTGAGVLLGTPAYMSPEQGAGEREMDGRSDIYSLGCVIYEMLVGEPPFTGPTPQSILAKRLTTPAAPVRSVRPGLSKAIEAVVSRALDPVPDRRYATAAELRDALARAAVGTPA